MSSGQKLIKISAICLAIFIIVNILNAIFMGIGLLSGFNISSKQGRNYVETYQEVSQIKIDVNASKVIVRLGSELKVEANNVSKNFTSKLVNMNILKIEEHDSWFWNHRSGEIIVTIPENMPLEELDIDCGAGKIEIDSITARKLDLDAGAGLLTINHSNFSNTDIDGGAGELKITSSILRNLDLDAGVGKVSIEGEIYGHSQIDCGIGEVNFDLGNSENYHFMIQKGLGSIRVNGVNYNDDTTIGTGENIVKISGGIGSININYNESKLID